jgi:hypothetical protein
MARLGLDKLSNLGKLKSSSDRIIEIMEVIAWE